MPSIKAIKRRIGSVTTTKQVMKAMDMVAASKLQKIRARLDAARPLFQESKRIMDSLKNSEEATEHVFVKPRKNVRNAAYIIITSDRGLCGSYNVNVCEAAYASMGKDTNEKIIAVGLKGWEFFRRRKKNLIHRYVGVSESALYEDAERIAEQLISMYASGEVDEVYVAYTRFESSLTYIPQVLQVLPIDGEKSEEHERVLMRYEPDIQSFADYVIPMYIKVFIYGALVESATCEQAARMISMSSASNNASDIIEDLTRAHNRIRQASITQEINEIISGANMLH